MFTVTGDVSSLLLTDFPSTIRFCILHKHVFPGQNRLSLFALNSLAVPIVLLHAHGHQHLPLYWKGEHRVACGRS